MIFLSSIEAICPLTDLWYMRVFTRRAKGASRPSQSGAPLMVGTKDGIHKMIPHSPVV